MTQTNPILPEVRAGTVSREALVQAALKEITQNYREASLSNVAREYGVSLAYVSECVRAARGNTGWCAPAMAAPAHKVLTLKAGTAAHRFSRKCSSPCFLPFWSILRYFGAGTGFLW